MRTTPALALVAAFLASTAVNVVASPHPGSGHAPANLHRRACKVPGHRHHQRSHEDAADNAPAPVPMQAPAADKGAAADFSAAENTPASMPGALPAVPGDASQTGPDNKMRKKKHKGKCALKPSGQGQGLPGQPAADGGAQDGAPGSGLPPVGGAPGTGGQEDQAGDMPPISGPPGGDFQGGASQGAPTQPGTGFQGGGGPSNNGAADPGSVREGYSDEGTGFQQPPQQPGTGAPGSGPSSPGGSPGQGSGGQPGSSPGGASGQSGAGGFSGQDQEGYNPTTPPHQAGKGDMVQDKGSSTHCKGIQGSAALPTNGKIKPEWFDPSLIHHGPGTQFGGGDSFWNGGACMFDDMPHYNLPSVAMDQSFFQDGLACGTCVEIASTSASLFSNDAKWSVETPKKGTLPPGKKTIAIVSDLCPGVNQCWSGLDMHPDAWNSVTNGANGSKLPINWKFVNCKEAFEKSGSGIKNLQVHWRDGANPGFFEVQIRGNHEAVVRVEMKWGSHGWADATLVDNSWWKWADQSQAGFDKASSKVTFRITDWQGQTITSEVGTTMGKDLFFEANFDRVESYEA